MTCTCLHGIIHVNVNLHKLAYIRIPKSCFCYHHSRVFSGLCLPNSLLFCGHEHRRPTAQTPASGARPPGWLRPFPLRLPASPSVFFFVNSPLLSSSPFSRSVTTPRASPPPRAPARPGALPSRSSARPPHSCPCSRPGLCAAALTPHFFSFPLFLQTMYFCVQEHLKLFLLT